MKETHSPQTCLFNTPLGISFLPKTHDWSGFSPDTPRFAASIGSVSHPVKRKRTAFQAALIRKTALRLTLYFKNYQCPQHGNTAARKEGALSSRSPFEILEKGFAIADHGRDFIQMRRTWSGREHLHQRSLSFSAGNCRNARKRVPESQGHSRSELYRNRGPTRPPS